MSFDDVGRSVRETSVQTYHEIEDEGLLGEMQLKVFNALKELGEASDREIAHYLSAEDPNSVRPRRKELSDLDLIMEAGKRHCTVSGRMVLIWTINPSPNRRNRAIVAPGETFLESIREGIKTSKHCQELHKVKRELVLVTLATARLQYNKDLGVFLCVNVAECYPRVQVIKKQGKDFICDCDAANDTPRKEGLATCEHEGALWVGFKIGYFKQPKSELEQKRLSM